MAGGWLRRCKGAAILALMFLLIASLHYLLPAPAPIADWIEARLLTYADSPSSVVMVLAISCYHLWLIAKALAFPLIVVGLAVLIEWQLSEVEREPKNRLMAGLIQATFLFITYAATLATSKLIPLPNAILVNLQEADSSMGTLAALAVYLIGFDILLYWTHRMHHAVPLLWKFHAVHHSPNDLDALHNFVHPVELLVRYFTIVLPLSLLIQVDQFQFYAVFAFLAVQNQLNHMNIPVNFGFLGRVLVDNRHHFIHHSRDAAHYNRNFAAIFSFTDRLFGTYEPPVRGPLPKTGFDPGQRPERLVDYLLARATRLSVPSSQSAH